MRIAKQAGWEVGTTKKGHIRFVAPDGTIVIHSSTPSDHRAWKNLRGALRRSGLAI